MDFIGFYCLGCFNIGLIYLKKNVVSKLFFFLHRLIIVNIRRLGDNNLFKIQAYIY